MRYIFSLFSLVFLAHPSVLAAYNLLPPSTQQELPYTNISAITLISQMIAYAIGLGLILAVIGITWGGIQMILSTGDDEKLKKGRHIIIYSLIGVLVSGLAYSVVTLVSGFRL